MKQPIVDQSPVMSVSGDVVPPDAAQERSSTLDALDLQDPALVAAWCERYGVTREHLVAAVGMVGSMPAALSFYLTSRGRPTKRITDEMRASRGPIAPRDRRRKAAIVASEGVCSLGEHERLAQEKAVLESDLRVAADGLHAHLCPATIHAYDEAQRRLEQMVVKLEAAVSALPPTGPRPEDASGAGVR